MVEYGSLRNQNNFWKSGKSSMNFLEDHFSRELGALPLRKWQLRKSIWHQSHQMLRHVVLSKHRKFKKLPVLVSNGQVLYEDGKLFLAHKGTSAMDCHFLREGGRGCDNLSKALRLRYSIPLKPTWKDQVRSKEVLLSVAIELTHSVSFKKRRNRSSHCTLIKERS